MALHMLRQILASLFSLAVVTTTVFVLLRTFGDPTPNLLPNGTPEQIAQLRENLGLNQPIPIQLLDYLYAVATGSFGKSYYSARSAIEILLPAIAVTSKLVVGGLLFALIVGVPLGVVAALRKDTALDRIVAVVTILGQSVPAFWSGLILVLIFSVNLQWLPSSGTRSLSAWILPIVTIGFVSMAKFTRIVRASLIEELESDYVRTARSKGLSEFAVTIHALRNALIPLITLMGFRVAELITGSVVVEVVFGISGLGKVLVYDGVFNRDFPVVQAGVILSAFAVITINLIVDWVYRLIDPRIQAAH